MTFIPEEEVLKAKPRVKDENDWPIYPLKNVTIYDSSSRIASLFSADDHKELLVEGTLTRLNSVTRLTPKYADSKHLVRAADIKVRKVDRFSYGQFEDGEVGLWAAGKAGWYQISPSRDYKPIYDDMVEALKVLYFVADKYRHQKLKKKAHYSGSAETLFNEYVEFTNGRCASSTDAEAIFYKHRQFLIVCMKAGKEDVVWTKTPLYHHLRKKFPHDFKLTRQEEDGQGSSNVPLPEAAETKKDTPVRKPYQGKSTSTLRPTGTKILSKGSKRVKIEQDDGTDVEEEISTPTKRKDTIPTEEQPPKRPAPGVGNRRNRSAVPAPDELPPQHPSSSPPPRKKRLILKATPIPGTSANGPGDSWTCEIDGCSYKVYAASTEASKVHIDRHYEEHAASAKRMIDLVLGESKRDNQPATYLTAYIAERKSTVTTTADGKKFPKPIVSKYYGDR
ncbi:MAG: hypothetical protein M1812_004143 [Candelaria pacifica]|nr:MAG: hypothetical protein M1812_004143 [Candelaria pacifica]